MNSPGLGWAPHPMTGILRPEGKGRGHTEEGHVMTKAETGVMLPHAQGAWGRQKWERQEGMPWGLQREPGPANHLTLDFWSPEQGENGVLLF